MNMKANTVPDWHTQRRGYIGASDSPMMLGHSPWGGPLTLWMSKTQADYQSPETDDQKIGKALEPVILEWWGRNVGDDVFAATPHLTHPDEPRMGCNLDAWGYLRLEDPNPVVVEAKTATWKDRDSLVAWRDGLAPPVGKWAAYWIQVQHQLEVVDCDRGFLAVLIDRGFYSVEIERDRAFGAHLRKAIGEWWARHIEGGEMPQGTAADGAALAMIPATEGKAVDLPHLAAVVEDLREVKTSAKALEKRQKALEAEIKSAMGDAEIATFGPDGPKRVTWKKVAREGRTVTYEPTSYRMFRS